MATDFTSAILTTKTKSLETKNLNVSNVVDSQKIDKSFDSVFSNVSKSYTDNSEIKKNDIKNDFANKTKDSKPKQNENIEHKKERANLRKTNENAENKQVVENKKTTDNQTETKTVNKTENIEKTEKVNTQNKKQIQTNENNNENSSIEQNNDIQQKDENVDVKNANENVGNVEAEKLQEQANIIANEQLLANVEQNNVQNTNLQTIEQVINSQNTENNIQNILNIVDTKTQNIAENPTNTVTLNTLSENNSSLKQQNVATQILNDTNVQLELPNDLKQILNIENNTQEQLTVSETNQELPEVDLDLKIKTDNIVKQDTKNIQLTAKENLSADTTRILLNLDDTQIENTQQTQTVTPTSTNQTNNEEPMIRVTENVISQLDTKTTNFIENKDFASNIKNKATAKMGELQGTSTIVTDVQNHQSNGAETSNQNNNSLTQGNAAEQTIKLTVENTNPNSSFAENFINQIDAKMTNSNNISSKLLNQQNQLLNKTDILSQMNAKFNEMQQAGSNKVSIVLQPESLGKVSVEIMNSKDGIIAKMTTDNQQVKELFDKNVESLKASLSSQGVNVNNIKVECSHQSENNAMDFERQQFNQNFNNQSNNQNHTNHSNSNNSVETSSYSNDFETQEEQTEEIEQNEVINTKTTIEHNGKIDYKV